MKNIRNYSMQKLMEIPGISVAPVFQSIPSRIAFFEYMDTLLRLSDAVLDEYATTIPVEKENQSYLARLSALQSRFLKLNATKAVWEIERFSEAVRSGDQERAQKYFLNLSDTLHYLCKKIRNAQIELPYEPPGADTEAPAQSGKIAAGSEKELFEKILILIKSFEINAALDQLQALESFSFAGQTERRLREIHQDLMRFAYSEAITKLAALIRSLDNTSDAYDAKTARKKILVIDDMPVVLSSIKSMIDEQYAVFCVTDHMAALKYLSSHTADLILLDIEMPDMDGFTLLGIIRKIELYRGTPVIFLTGNANSDYVKKAILHGGTDFIKKPVDKPTLLARLAKQLG